jgi:hypothetical protein
MAKSPAEFEAIFNGISGPVDPTPRDILSIGYEDGSSLATPVVNSLMLQSARTTDIADLAGLRRRVAEFIHVNSIRTVATSLSNLNRRFSRVAKQFGTSVSQIVDELIKAEVIMFVEHNKRRALLTVAMWDEAATMRARYVDDPIDMREVVANLIDGAQ